VRDGRLRTDIGNIATLDDAAAAFNPTERVKGTTIIRFVLAAFSTSPQSVQAVQGVEL
jgi:hypothetical protein